ncbi:hypothetical protein TEA_022550 [Camellia sinensis var. sinensis]|uniref:S-protein homolog n=1 Tax=Camellia sinensis var. sinensis TaxID=542762 RepID=A0A4S4D5R9_CAMSN|nr:hypothetical protein TEA_022550 [Camellia sinensis var. sinensis]
MGYMMSLFSLLVLILALHFASTVLYANPDHVRVEDGITTRFVVYITSRLPDTPGPLKLHCQSKDNDIGVHFLNNGQNFAWSFRENIIPPTLFICQFRWNSKDRSFIVFYRTLKPYCEEPWRCIWVVTPNGFYLGNGNPSTPYYKIDDW